MEGEGGDDKGQGLTAEQSQRTRAEAETGMRTLYACIRMSIITGTRIHVYIIN